MNEEERWKMKEAFQKTAREILSRVISIEEYNTLLIEESPMAVANYLKKASISKQVAKIIINVHWDRLIDALTRRLENTKELAPESGSYMEALCHRLEELCLPRLAQRLRQGFEDFKKTDAMNCRV